MTHVTPEIARARQEKCRSKKRARGLELINQWTHTSIRPFVYDIIKKINADHEDGSTDFLKFIVDIINADSGSILRARKVNDKWHFELFPPQN